MRMWFIDPVSKRKSVTLTSFVIGYLISILKLLFGGFVLFHIQIPAFSGFEFAAAVGALGGVYTMRRTKSGQSWSAPPIQVPGQENNG